MWLKCILYYIYIHKDPLWHGSFLRSKNSGSPFGENKWCFKCMQKNQINQQQPILSAPNQSSSLLHFFSVFYSFYSSHFALYHCIALIQTTCVLCSCHCRQNLVAPINGGGCRCVLCIVFNAVYSSIPIQ